MTPLLAIILGVAVGGYFVTLQATPGTPPTQPVAAYAPAAAAVPAQAALQPQAQSDCSAGNLPAASFGPARNC